MTSPETSNYFKTHKAELQAAKQSMLQQRSANSKGDVPSAQDVYIKVHAIRYSNGSGAYVLTIWKKHFKT
ncbi:hypothetical protein JCM19274_4513 [Algibacter lectus]|uniref:Uncharacterized protein n=1 Tax=Algibacter lectus TaxID=221126 RepID=A0A090WRN9_9FLAO|nr:hypothetical protein JCM19274_4513 [Algibacter lectus]